MLRGDVQRAPPRAALRTRARFQHAAAPSLRRAARSAAPLRVARAELARGGGADDASAPLTAARLDAALDAALRPVHEGLASLLSVAAATSDNVGALAEAVAGGGAASEWSRALVCSLGELGAAVLGHEEGDDESRAVVRQLCASLAPDVRACVRACVRRRAAPTRCGARRAPHAKKTHPPARSPRIHAGVALPALRGGPAAQRTPCAAALQHGCGAALRRHARPERADGRARAGLGVPGGAGAAV